MGTEEDGQSNGNRKRNDATEKSKKGNTKRGTTIMIELNKKWDGNKIRVVYDEKGRPNNRVVRRKLAGMEGALARSKVPLSEFETWHDLPEPLRDDLWEAMQKEEFGSSVEHDDRSVKWLRARQKKNGEFVNDATMEIAERIVEDRDTLSKMLPNLEISTPKVKDLWYPKMKKTPTNHEFSTPKEGDGDFDAPEKASNDKKSNKQGVKCSLTLTLESNIVAKGSVFKNTRPQENINDIPLGEANFREEKHDLLGSEKARKDNKGKQIKDFGVVAKSKKALPNFEISTPMCI
ncbi:hypothetical protein IFM89_000273 [Coptis chinensis]|uniref:Uncharacterized protein n=1 Tax=Coptis chinensis TaxID=261450 RepID=A0A835H803_9MAGN|nr:hypothetical protein IFM89_000273 [Coptis chinensis]